MRILTMEELYKFFEERQITHYSAAETGRKLVVSVPGSFSAQEAEEDGKLPVVLKACHTGLNRNNSYIQKEVMEKALPSLKDRPILGHIVELEDGTFDFFSHDFEIDEETGEVVYQELPIGVTQDTENAHLEYDTEADRDYVVVNGVIWEEYGNKAADIIRRKNGTKVSVELSISDLSFNSKEKYLEINDFYFSGITCLGTNPETNVEIKEGMEGARLDLNFDEENKNEEGGDPVDETREMLEEELPPIEENEEAAGEQEGQDESVYSITIKGHTFNYEISMNDTISALSNLVATVYGESDNEWYSVIAYENYLVMQGFWTGRAYRQSYTKDGDNYTLTGDREEVFVNYLTKSEEDALEEMRSNYEALVKFKADTESAQTKAQKDAVLADEKFDKIRDTEGFKSLCDDMDKFSADELSIRATALLGDYYAQFEAKDHKETKKVGFESKSTGAKNPYGNLFNK